jgi:hypothetical protein
VWRWNLEATDMCALNGVQSSAPTPTVACTRNRRAADDKRQDDGGSGGRVEGPGEQPLRTQNVGSPRSRAKRGAFTMGQNKCILEAARAVTNNLTNSATPRRFEEAWKRLQRDNSAGLGGRSLKELSDQYNYLCGEARRAAGICP